MNKNNGVGVSTTSKLHVGADHFGKSGKLDKVTIFFERIFCKEETMIDKNEFVFLFLQNEIAGNNIEVINQILSDTVAINDFKPSLIKSLLIMTEDIDRIDVSARMKVETLLSQKMKK